MTDEEYNYKLALIQCADRYIEMADEGSELAEFIEKFRAAVNINSLPKSNRWLGYIQGQLIAQGDTTVQAERDWTRPLFKHLDEALTAHQSTKEP